MNSSVSRIRSENNQKLSELTSTIQQLTLENQRLQQEREEWVGLAEENRQLVEMLRRTRVINADCDRLWSTKEQEYEKIHHLLTRLPQ